MSADLQLFNVQGADIRFGTTDDGIPYAVASDFAKSMGYRDAANALRILDEDEKGTQLVSTPGGPQQMNVIFEDGMWELIFRSTLDGAKLIKKQIKAILKQIRETGSYSITSGSAEVMPSQALRGWAAELEARELAEARVAELEPAAESWNQLATADGDFSVADAAKILSRDPNIKLGRDRLFNVMDEQGWIYRQQIDGRWRVYQPQVDLGRLSELPSSHYHPRTGELVLDAPQVRITVKGLGELHKRLGGSGQMQIGRVA